MHKTKLRLWLPFSSKSRSETLIRSIFTEFTRSDEIENLRNLRRQICELEMRAQSVEVSKNVKRLILVNRVQQRKINLLLTSFAFSRSFSYAKMTNSKLWYPLPKDWISCIEEGGYPVNRCISRVMYFLTCSFLFHKNILRFNKSIFSKATFLRSEFFENDSWLQNAKESVLVGIYSRSVLRQDLKSSFENFGNWLKVNSTKLGISESNCNLHMSGDTKQDFRFISRFVFNYSILKDLLTLSMKEYLEVSTFIDISEIQLKRRMQAHLENPSEYLGKVIIFNNSQKNSLPIWTEDLQALGARVCLMFYSTESEVRFLSGRPPQIEYWGLAQWPEIWCVDKTQKSELLSLDLVSTNNIKVIGYPWWSDDDYVPVSSKKKTLIYFSLEPHISDFSLTPSYSYGFGDPNMAVMTLLDILELSQELGFHVRHKVKRHLNSERFPVYANALEEFQTRFADNYELINPKVASSRLMSSGEMVISDPFTTTGEEAFQKGLPSIYYSSKSDFPDCASRMENSRLIRSREELRFWLKNNL
jgi:hypothetical protein